jgi:carbamoyl-phosphate synthase large subunit
MDNCYISSVGGDIAQSVIRIISQTYPRAYLFGTDIQIENPGYYLVSKFATSPAASCSNYLSWLSEFLANNNIEFFVPINENELLSLAKLSDFELKSLLGDTRIIWPGKLVVETFSSKKSTQSFLQQHGIQNPRLYLDFKDLTEYDFPLVVKPDFGAGSRNILVCHTDSELNAALTLFPSSVVQKHIGDPMNEFTAAVFRCASGLAKVIVFRRTLSGGTTSWARVVQNQEFDEICLRIAEAINLNGSINIQFRIDSGQPSIFEVNGRFSSTVQMRHLLGFRDVLWSLGDLSGFEEFDSRNVLGMVSYKGNVVNVVRPE